MYCVYMYNIVTYPIKSSFSLKKSPLIPWCAWLHLGTAAVHGGAPKSFTLKRMSHYKPTILGEPYFRKAPYMVILAVW